MDSKGRIAIPSDHRDRLIEHCGGEIVLTKHLHNRSVHIVPKPFWEGTYLPKISKLKQTKKLSRQLRLRVLGNAHECTIEANGRLMIPPPLRAYGNLEKKLCLLGSGNGYELWNEDDYNRFDEEEIEDTEELLEELDTLEL